MNTNDDWLQKRVDKYRAERNNMCEAIEEPDDMDKLGQGLGQGFTSADPLEEVDIGDGIVPRPMFVSKNLEADYKSELIALVKEYVDCFAWEYHEMPGLSRELVESALLIPCMVLVNNDNLYGLILH